MILTVHSNRTVTILYPTASNAQNQMVVNFDRLRPYFSPLLLDQHQVQDKVPQSILCHRLHNGVDQYKVKWLSSTPLLDSWVDASTLPPELINSFFQKHNTNFQFVFQAREVLQPPMSVCSVSSMFKRTYSKQGISPSVVSCLTTLPWAV